MPRTGLAKLNWTADGCSVVSVELRNYPDEEDIEKARREDPNDHSWVWWQFNVENRGDAKCRIRLWVEVLDKNRQGSQVRATATTPWTPTSSTTRFASRPA